jgi:ATP-dependent DNA helicase RecG
MTENDINKIISQGEGVSIEFKKAKESIPANLFETICAFFKQEWRCYSIRC